MRTRKVGSIRHALQFKRKKKNDKKQEKKRQFDRV